MENRMEAVLSRLETLQQQKKRILLAIDGGCATGKTTLGQGLAERVPAALVHMDDFFLPPQLRTAERYAQPGGNVHYERVLQQVLEPFLQGKPIRYAPFDCHKMAFGPEKTLPQADILIVEGVYSLHPRLREQYDLRILLTEDKAVRLERLRKRCGAEGVTAFTERWIPLEDAYFQACGVADCCDLIL